MRFTIDYQVILTPVDMDPNPFACGGFVHANRGAVPACLEEMRLYARWAISLAMEKLFDEGLLDYKKDCSLRARVIFPQVDIYDEDEEQGSAVIDVSYRPLSGALESPTLEFWDQSTLTSKAFARSCKEIETYLQDEQKENKDREELQALACASMKEAQYLLERQREHYPDEPLELLSCYLELSRLLALYLEEF